MPRSANDQLVIAEEVVGNAQLGAQGQLVLPSWARSWGFKCPLAALGLAFIGQLLQEALGL